MRQRDKFFKRTFDLFVSALGLVLFGWVILLGYIAASLSTKSNGLFMQERVGCDGKYFRVYKLKTMKEMPDIDTTVTTAADRRITRVGAILRKSKVDELPQLVNVLIGDMSLVGPRPDVPGFADQLKGEDRIVLSIRPGITGPATLKYRNEEELLASVENPEVYNKEVIYPDKVKINKEYIKNYNFFQDLKYLYQTIRG